MMHTPTAVPLPAVTPLSEPFWDGCAERRLLVQHCLECNHHQLPPLLSCANCGENSLDWVESSGQGRVITYTVIHHSPSPALKEQVPYLVVLVKLDDCEAQLISNLVDTDTVPEIDTPVALVWDDLSGMTLPRFKRA